jgi:hypothetical protein
VVVKKIEGQTEPSNPGLAAAAEKAIYDKGVTGVRGMCQKFFRQVVQKKYGNKYDGYHKGTAEASRRAWAQSAFAVDPARGSVVGDILYKKGTAGQPEGHVGVRVPGNRVAENATTSQGRKQGAKGYRSLESFGRVDLIVRLPRS